MEIEAKFAIPNRATYRQVAHLRELAGFTLRPVGVVQVADRYFDTAEGRLLSARYTCRLRAGDGDVIATLKGLGRADGAVHRRVEEEVRLPEWTPDPHAWPASAARTLALDLTSGAPLQPLFDLAQRRDRTDVFDGVRRVAQLSFDHVRLVLTGLHGAFSTSYYELEAELVADGTEADLAKIAGELAAAWRLAPEPRSKFERGLAEVQTRRAAFDLGLTPDERQALNEHAANPASTYAGRALAVLGWADGLATSEIVERSHLSPGRVRDWVRAFRGKRLGILGAADPAGPARSAASAPARHAPARHAPACNALPPPTATPAARPREVSPAALLTVGQLCKASGVDLPHARYVADRARLLFDTLKNTHRLPKRRRKLLRAAALLQMVGFATDAEHPWQAGRDLILAQPLRGVTTSDRLALACIVAFGGGKVRAEREPTLAALDEKLRSQVLALAALVRVAEAMDFSRTQATEVQTIEDPDARRCEILLTGPSAGLDAAQASSQSDLWYQLFKQELAFVAPAQLAPDRTAATVDEDGGRAIETAAEGSAAPLAAATASIAPDDLMSEAARKLLYLHFSRMLANEAGTRLGDDIEALHDMRVATRRMRAAFALCAPYFDEEILAPFGKGLRRTGRTLGAVRDLDVLLDKARAYAATLPPESASTIDPLLSEWETARSVARRQMLEYLDGGAYRRFVADFGGFLTQPGAGARTIPDGAPTPTQVRHIVPSLIWTRYEAVRAYERLLPGAPLPTYHALRIDCKGLRYAMEFFRELLGEDGAALIKQVTGMQDLLGELQDAYVAEGLLSAFLAERRRTLRKRPAEIPLPGVETYMDQQRARQAELVTSFPSPWADLVGLVFRRRLASAIATI